MFNSIKSGGTLATVRMQRDGDWERHYLSLTVMIPSLFPDCATKDELTLKVEGYAKPRIGDWIRSKWGAIVAGDSTFSNLEVDEFELSGITMLVRVDIAPVAEDDDILDFFTDFESYN